MASESAHWSAASHNGSHITRSAMVSKSTLAAVVTRKARIADALAGRHTHAVTGATVWARNRMAAFVAVEAGSAVARAVRQTFAVSTAVLGACHFLGAVGAEIASPVSGHICISYTRTPAA